MYVITANSSDAKTVLELATPALSESSVVCILSEVLSPKQPHNCIAACAPG